MVASPLLDQLIPCPAPFCIPPTPSTPPHHPNIGAPLPRPPSPAKQNNGVKRLADNYYVRGDGTRAFYFSQALLQGLFAGAGLRCSRCTMHERQVENRKRGLLMQRKWVQVR